MSTKKYAVLGYPIHHSKSPLLHNASYRHLGLDGDYSSVEVRQGELSSFVEKNRSEFGALSITMPLKEEAFALATTCDELSSNIRVANTLIQRGGEWFGTNTDILGFKEILTRQFSSSLQDPIILGSGSTAKSALVALSKLGVTSIRMMARNVTKVEHIRGLFPTLQITYCPWGGEISDASLVISAVPEVSGVSFSNTVSQFLDVNYSESRKYLVESITAPKYRYIDGLNLLVYQAAHQVLQMHSVDESYYEEIVQVMFKTLDKEH